MSISKKSSYYVTTPIYYANGHPHLGNTYTTTVADTLTRFYRFMGYDAFFLTGTDEHGDKVSQAAQAAGKDPYTFTTEVSDLFKRTWKDLGLEYSRFIRTTDRDHKQVVAAFLQRIYDKGDIYFGEYGGNYCFGCERFLTDKELVDGKCPDHQVEPTFVKEKNYFFRMSKYQQQLLDHITNFAPDFIRPERYKNEVLAMLREPLDDLCISRPKTRLTWGIELPFDNNYVTYVWFDALLNYLTGIGYPDGPDFQRYWASSEHIIAKDILKPHAVFWPTMLFAADVPLYQHLNVHGYWVTPTGKMSKSLGNVVDPVSIKDQFGMDVFRYFVLREMTFGLDGTFAHDSFETRYNADLANNLGNLVSRSLAMVHRYRGGQVPSPDREGEFENQLQQEASQCTKGVIEFISSMEIHRALERIWQFIDCVNVYIDRRKPWSLAKGEKTDSSRGKELDTVLYTALEAVRLLGSLLTAFLPEASEKILRLLSFEGESLKGEQAIQAASTWGRLAPGTALKETISLFPRTDRKEEAKTDMEDNPQAAPAPEKPSSEPQYLTFEDFKKIDLKVGQIMEAERVPNSEKLVRLQVELGDEGRLRQIVAGIAKHYSPEDLVGRKIIVVANLKPAKLMGHVSEGMLLAATDKSGNLELISVGPSVSAGSSVS